VNTAARILAVMAAMFLVLAFALAATLTPVTTLGQALSAYNHDGLVAFQNAVRGHFSEWAWLNLVLPVLLRPAWLLPTGCGLVAAGVAATVASRAASPHSRRRRS
jgi:hypothetical protein